MASYVRWVVAFIIWSTPSLVLGCSCGNWVQGERAGGDRGNILKIQRKGSKAGNAVRSEAAQRRAADLLPVIESIRAEGAQSLALIADGLNSRGIAMARGGEWSPVQVLRVLDQATV